MMKAVVIRKYDNAMQAYVDAEYLRSEGVECEVMENSPFSSLMPGAYQLVVLEDVEQKAKELLKR